MEEELIKRFELCVKKLIELEAMKAANYERIQNGEALAYGESHFEDLNFMEL
jgi:hypothetical protein